MVHVRAQHRAWYMVKCSINIGGHYYYYYYDDDSSLEVFRLTKVSSNRKLFFFFWCEHSWKKWDKLDDLSRGFLV